MLRLRKRWRYTRPYVVSRDDPNGVYYARDIAEDRTEDVAFKEHSRKVAGTDFSEAGQEIIVNSSRRIRVRAVVRG